MAKAISCYDVHCHILPGIDYGTAAIEESSALAKAYVGDGVLGVVATPHVTMGSDIDSFLTERANAHLKLEGAIVIEVLALRSSSGPCCISF